MNLSREGASRWLSSRWLRTWAPLVFYLILSLAFFGRDVSWSKYYFGYSTDSLLFIWYLNWWPFALSHGLNPFITHYAWAPAGYNVTWATSIGFFALLAWPITALGGPVLSYNILMLSAPALAGWAAFLLARELTKGELTQDWAAALVCGVLFAFSAPEMFQLAIELNLDSVFLIPLSFLLCIRRLRGKLRRLPFVLLLSLLLLAQLGISTEVLTTLCLTGALSWLIFLLFTPAGARGPFWRLAADIALTAPLVMVLAAPFLYYLVKGLPDVPAYMHPAFMQETELLQFIVPTLPITSAGALLHSIIQQGAGFAPDHYTFLNLPLLLILALYFYRHIGKTYVKALGVLLCIIAVFSLGLKLLVNGHLTGIPLPWTLLSHVPLIRSVVPSRCLIYLTLGTAIATAFYLAEAKTTRARWSRFALAAFACLLLPPAKVLILPEPWLTQPIFQDQNAFKWTLWPTQPFFTPAHIRAALGPNPNVLLLPDPVVGPGMAWQVDAGMGFTQAEGYVGYVLNPELKWGFLDELIWNDDPGFGAKFQAFCAAHKVDYVLIGPGTPPGITAAIEALGWPHHMDSGIEIVKIPASSPALTPH